MSHAVVNPDREGLIQCPYDPVHMISQMRFPYHLIKCRKNHQGKEYQQCPYDAEHVIPREKFQDHLVVCDKRAIVEPQLVLDDHLDLELIIPESKANAIAATLSSEWDLEMPSATQTKKVVIQTKHNTFKMLGSRDQQVPRQPAAQPAKSSFTYEAQPSSYKPPRSFEPSSYQPPRNFEPEETVDTVPRAPRQPNKYVPANSKAINQPDKPSYNHQKSFGRGRGARNGIRAEPSFSVEGPGPSSYSIRSMGCAESYSEPRESYSYSPPTMGGPEAIDPYNPPTMGGPERIDPYNPPTMSYSLGRGRGGASLPEEIALRRPGVSKGAGMRESLIADQRKFAKKIRDTKVLEERLNRGEVLESNQVDKISKLAQLQNNLNKVTKQLQFL